MIDDFFNLYDKNRDYFTASLAESQDVFWIVNNDYSVQIYVSPAFEQIWGYSSSLLYENPLFWLQTIYEDDRQQLASLSKMPHSCVQSTYEEKYRIVRADGEIRWIRDHTHPILNEIGQCIGYAGIARDITQTLKLERELQIAYRFLPKLAERMERSAFWVRDSTLTKQLYLSKGFEKIWQRSSKYLYEHPEQWIETILEEDRKRDATSMLTAVYKRGKDAQFSDFYRIVRPSGEIRWIRDVSFPIYDDETDACIGFAGIAEDVTQEKLYEMELQKAKDKAEAANIAKSNFIASMSHDFRTPLNGLLGMAEILREGKCYPEQREYIEAILQAGNSLLDLVEDIINFVALDLDKLPVNEEWFNLEKLVEEIILTISPQAHEKKVQIIFSYSEILPKEFFGDVSRVRRILMNLVNNAVKFTSKGHVLINVELHKETKRKIWVQFIVEDTGIGISQENFEYIFGSFNRVDPSYRGRYKGTGLGLTIVKQFIEDLGGTIKLQSEINQGSIFYCNVPFKHKKKVTLRVSDHYSNLRLLIVDDFKKRATTFIKRFGFKNADIVSGKNVLSVLEEACAGGKHYQLILVDDELNYDLVQLSKDIKERDPNCVLIMIADQVASHSAQKLKKMGYLDCITKPLQPLVVVNILEDAAVLLSSQSKEKRGEKKLKSRTVLLVEDDVLTQKITRWMLEELDCIVDVAGAGWQALEYLDNAYDLIVMDIGLPDMDGIQLAEKIRSSKPRHKDTPIVALTAHVLDQDKEKCLQAGMNDFLKKPLFKQDLKKLLLKIF